MSPVRLEHIAYVIIVATMRTITFVTGNQQKLMAAQAICGPLGITIINEQLDIVEIQSENAEDIAIDKAAKAYAGLGRPIVVNDDAWLIPGLNGFPGPYMKSINHWFSSDDWLRLTRDLADRRIILRQYIVYQDAGGQKVFRYDIEGRLLTEARGEANNHNDTIVSFNDEGLSNAEVRATGKSSIEHRETAWHAFAAWLQTRENL